MHMPLTSDLVQMPPISDMQQLHPGKVPKKKNLADFSVGSVENTLTARARR
jgi:hypothetical protein